MLTRDGFEPPLADTIYLSDVSPKDKPWDKHRAAADRIMQNYRDTLFDRYAQRIAGCSGVLQFEFFTNKDTGETKLRLTACKFCRCRHCPICQWRRQLRWRARFFDALPRILKDHPKARFIFLTLTVKNCPVTDLRSTLAWMNKSWILMTKRKQFPALGWLKSVEVTRSANGDAHPHFHAILMVNEGYFKRGYLSKEKWIALWRDCLGVEYDPSIAVRVVKSSSTQKAELNQELMKGFCEVLKYSLKPEDLVTNKDWLLEITTQLHKTRAVAVGGIFRQYISEREPEDLIGEDENPEDTSGLPIWFGWREALARYSKIDVSTSD
jgi:plasmid rolling circle replication initiator protein Rep